MPRFKTSILLVLAFQGLPLASAQEHEAYYLNLRRNHPVGETDWSNDVQGGAHADLDGDGDADLADFAEFQVVFTE